MSAKKKKNKPEKNINDAVFKEAVDDFDRFEDFVSTNLNQIVWGAVIIVIGLAIFFVVYEHVQTAENKACVALSSAKDTKELNKALKKYPDSKGDASAKLNLGTLYFKEGKYQEALEAYQNLADSADPGDIKSRAALNTAYILEAMEKQEQAAEKFAEVGLDANSPEYIRNEANYSAGRLFFAINKPSRASSCLKSIKTETGSFWGSQAKRLLQRVEEKDPEPKASPASEPAPKKAGKTVKKAEKK